jgi:hypothetical protein
VYNDLGSGSNVDLCIITKDGVDYKRNHEFLMGKTYTRVYPVKYPKGTARKWLTRAGLMVRVFGLHDTALLTSVYVSSALLTWSVH